MELQCINYLLKHSVTGTLNATLKTLYWHINDRNTNIVMYVVYIIFKLTNIRFYKKIVLTVIQCY